MEARVNEILQGDARWLAGNLPDESVNCIVTSPPYFGLRDYGTGQWEGGDPGCDHRKNPAAYSDKALAKSTIGAHSNTGHAQEGYRSTCGKCGARRIDSQLGLEETPDEYIDKLVDLFRELRRALRRDGTLWLNLGDSYAGSGGAGGDYNAGGIREGQPRYRSNFRPGAGLRPKNLIGIPWRAAFALQADGWYLRQDVIWAKRSPMPEPAQDRPARAHEYLFLLTREARYWYDALAVREKGAKPGETRNLRSVWTLSSEPYKGAHFAVMPTKLVEPCIRAGCPHKVCSECGAPWVRRGKRHVDGWAATCSCYGETRPGVVLDPFLGSGTVGAVAVRNGRDWMGFELNPEYAELARERIYGTQPALFGEV